MNQYGQVVAFWFVKTGTMDEIRDAMRALRRRYVAMGWPLPVAAYSDRALQDNTFLQNVLLRPHHHGSHGNDNHDARNAVPSTSHSSTSVPQLTLPDQSCVILSQQPQDCEAAVRRVRVELTKTGDNFVGFDCEWDVPLRAGGSPIALMQISTATGVVAMFHLACMDLPCASSARGDEYEETNADLGGSKKLLPQTLTELLEDPNLKKVGSRIRGDFTRLKREYLLHEIGRAHV